MPGKQLSNSFSTGGGGSHFESHIQASFVVLMLTNGWVPCLRSNRISKILLQGKVAGYNTDDLIVFTETIDGIEDRKLLGQIKHEITISSNDKTFQEVIDSAWSDFHNSKLFIKNLDVIGLITGPLSATDISDARTILEWSRYCQDYTDLSQRINKSKFGSRGKIFKFNAFIDCAKKANNNTQPSDKDMFDFLRHFHIMGYDLDIKSGVILALIHSLIAQHSERDIEGIWSRIVDEVMYSNQNSGQITKSTLPPEIVGIFTDQANVIPTTLMPQIFPQPQSVTTLSPEQSLAGAMAALIGAWRDSSSEDANIIRRFIDGL